MTLMAIVCAIQTKGGIRIAKTQLPNIQLTGIARSAVTIVYASALSQPLSSLPPPRMRTVPFNMRTQTRTTTRKVIQAAAVRLMFFNSNARRIQSIRLLCHGGLPLATSGIDTLDAPLPAGACDGSRHTQRFLQLLLRGVLPGGIFSLLIE